MNRDENRYNVKKLSVSGITLALAVICLFLATTLPTSRLSFYALSSFLVSIIVIEFGIKTGWVFYFASCVLSFIVVQEKLELIPYIAFFGVYGIIKYYIEKMNNLLIEYILKFAFFNAVLVLSFLTVRHIFVYNLNIKLPWMVIIAALEAIFFIFDYVYTLFIQYYNRKLKSILKI